MDVAARVNALEAEGLDNRAALKRAARELGLNRSEAYRRLVAARDHPSHARSTPTMSSASTGLDR